MFFVWLASISQYAINAYSTQVSVFFISTLLCSTMNGKVGLLIVAIIIIVVSSIVIYSILDDNKKADTFELLSSYVSEGVEKIEVTSDIELTAPIFVTSEVTIYSTKDVVLKRSETYLGELFIIGENEDHSKPILDGKQSKLTLGNDKSDSGCLIIDGNEYVSSLGSMFLIVASGELVMMNDCTLQNGYKVGNERLLDTIHYITSSPESIDGAAVNVISGVFNMYGGVIKNCKSSLDTNGSSYLGGAIYNYGDFYMYGGSIEGNESARGGAIYDYKTVHIYAGSILNNNATSYGGGICCANSQYVNVYLGEKKAQMGTVLLQGNTSDGAGAAVYAKQKCSIVSYGGVTFKDNVSLTHGGAMYVAGTLWIYDTIFDGNNAKSQGGAIQLHDVDGFTPRDVTIINSTFTNNEAKTGGGLFSKTKGILTIEGCEFYSNHASESGGSIYSSASSNVTITNIEAAENEAKTGGFLFITDSGTTVSLITGSIKNNKAQTGEFIYGPNAESFVMLGHALDYNGTKEGVYKEVEI